MKIKPKNLTKAIQISINLNGIIKDLENVNAKWVAKIFGAYRLRNWVDSEIVRIRKAQENG